MTEIILYNVTGLIPEWEEVLSKLMDEVVPLMKAGVLAGIFMGDEVMCDRVLLSNYTSVGNAVRERIGKVGLITNCLCLMFSWMCVDQEFMCTEHASVDVITFMQHGFIYGNACFRPFDDVGEVYCERDN